MKYSTSGISEYFLRVRICFMVKLYCIALISHHLQAAMTNLFDRIVACNKVTLLLWSVR